MYTCCVVLTCESNGVEGVEQVWEQVQLHYRLNLQPPTGSSLNIVFFPKILKYSELWPFSVLPLCQCVYTHQAARTPALQQNWQSSEKSQNFKEKTQYLMNTLYMIDMARFSYS